MKTLIFFSVFCFALVYARITLDQSHQDDHSAVKRSSQQSQSQSQSSDGTSDHLNQQQGQDIESH